MTWKAIVKIIMVRNKRIVIKTKLVLRLLLAAVVAVVVVAPPPRVQTKYASTTLLRATHPHLKEKTATNYTVQ
jgi:hypothetical protein